MKKKMFWIGGGILLFLSMIALIIYSMYLREQANQHAHQFIDGSCVICGKEEVDKQEEEFRLETKEIIFNKEHLVEEISYIGQEIDWWIEEAYRESIELSIESEVIAIFCLKPFSKPIELVATKNQKKEVCMLHYKKELSFMELELFSLNHTILSNGYQEFQVTFLNPDSIYELQLQLKFHDFTIDASPVIQFELVLLKELEDFLSSKNISYQNKYRFQENQIDLSWAGIQNYFQIDGDPGLLDDYASDLVFLLNITVTLHEAESTIFYLLKDNGNRFQILDDVKFNQNNIIF